MKSSFYPLPGPLSRNPASQPVLRILNAALDAVDPDKIVRRSVHAQGDQVTIAGTAYKLSPSARVVVLAVGKASLAMARGLAGRLKNRIAGGIVVTKMLLEGSKNYYGPLEIYQGNHPVPGKGSLEAGSAAVRALGGLAPDDLVICLISGGGSALLALPVPGVSLEDLAELTRLLLACGASIHEINTLRKHLDQVKGGRLAQLASPAKVVTLVLSDVVGNSLETIASGPTVPDPTRFSDALEVIHRYRLETKVPASILSALKAGAAGTIPETLKPGELGSRGSAAHLVGSNLIAARAAVLQAKREGFHACLLTTHLEGEARQVGIFLAAVAKEIAASGHPIRTPACVVAGGETTVTLVGNGKGGRNQEVALGAVRALDGLPGAVLVTLATDGEDGPTGAAGAVITGDTCQQGAALGMKPEEYLQRNDSYEYFSRTGGLLFTGSTGTNVNDLAFIFIE